MKVITPEIAWHETLPIYSCDLQPPPKQSESRNTAREPLVELPTSDFIEKDKDDRKPSTSEPENNEPEKWTRMATAGGDNMVRLWRVNLKWSPPSSVTVVAPTKPPAKGLLARDEDLSGKNKKVLAGAPKVSAAVSDGLVFLATLKRHDRLVNVVRWSPSGTYLASAGDDQFVIIWSFQPDSIESKPPPLTGDTVDEQVNVEVWVPCRSLRRHLEDVYDLCWAPDESFLLSGSVDQSAIVWQLDLASGKDGETLGNSNVKAVILRDHKHYVQGVAWDPTGAYMATMSSDRTCRIYRPGSKQCLANISKIDKHHLFQDDSWKSFFRRPAFSPDGLLLLCPAGNLESAPFAGDMMSAVNAAVAASTTTISAKVDAVTSRVPIGTCETSTAPQHAAHCFLRGAYNQRPCLSLPTGPRPVIAVRFCPQPFHLRLSNPRPGVACSALIDLPYRWLFLLVLEDGLLFYDTQQVAPFAQVSQIHYQALNDAAWSNDGRLVVASSTDGYCSFVYFSVEELGHPYQGSFGIQQQLNPLEVTLTDTTIEKMKTPEKQDSSVEIMEATDEPTAKTPKRAQGGALHRVAKELSTEPKHISFQKFSTPEPNSHPSVTLPVTPNTGRFLSAPVPDSPHTSPEPGRVFGKRRIPFVTLSKGPVISTPPNLVPPEEAS